METYETDAQKVQQGYSSEIYGDKNDALIVGFKVAGRKGFCFVIEGKYGWHVNLRKPSIRFGKVIECRDDGMQYQA